MEIYKSINNVMCDVGAIGKGKYNAEQKFNYRGVEDVMNALQPLFIKHKLFAVPEVLAHTREERTTKSGGRLMYSIIKMKYTFYAADGSYVAVSVIGEGMDTADKSSNKAMSVAFKYACFQLFCIPTEEMLDPDADTHEVWDKLKPSDVFDMRGADTASNTTLFVNALEIAGLTNEDGGKIVKELFGEGEKVNSLNSVDFKHLITTVEKRCESGRTET